MGLNLGVMSAAVTLDDKDYRSKLSGLEGASENSFRRIAQLAAGYLSARALFGFVSGAMAEFSKLEEGNNKLKYTYTELREEASRAANALVQTYHVASSTATNALANVGDLLTGLGFSQRQALDFAKQITERGIDVASFKGLDQTEVIRKMTVALTGETESLKTMGVVIRQGSDAFEDQVSAIVSATGATETMAKAQVILKEIMRQTANAEGDYLRPDAPRTYAQELTDLKEAMKQFKTEIGSQVQPITQEMIVKARELLQWYNKLTPSAKSLANTTAALAAAMLVLSKTGLGKSIMTAKGASDAEIEAEKVKAQQEVVRAEQEKTDALYEAIHARQKLRIAEAEQMEAQKSLTVIQLQKAEAEAKGDTTAIAAASSAELKARAAVTAATIKARKAESEYHAARQKLATATANYRSMSAALPGVLRAIAASSTLLGKANIFAAMTFRQAAAAAKSFFASLGFIGWAILAIGVAIEATMAIIDHFNGNLEENARKAEEAADAAADASSKNAEYNASRVKGMERLQALQKYESLSTGEKAEAIKVLNELGIAYDENGKSIDEMISRQGEEKRSLEELTKARKDELKQKRIALLEDQRRKNMEAINANDERKVGAVGAFFRGLVSAGQWTGEGKNREIDEENQKYIKANDKIIEELNRLKYTEEEVGKSEKDRLNETISKSKEVRRAIEALKKDEWERDYSNGNATDKNFLLTQREAEILSRNRFHSVEEFKNADRNKMSEKELSDLREIVGLEEKRNQLRKQSADAFRQEGESYKAFLRQREKRLNDEAVERQLNRERKNGNQAGVDAIISREYEKARDAAKTLQREYERELKYAQEDKLLTEDEKKRRADLKSRMQSAMSDEDNWRKRSLEEQDKKNLNTGNTVGNFSAAILAAQLGTNSPEKETAKNTKEMVSLQRRTLEKIGTGSGGGIKVG